ncbi:MAG: hypothetical protein KDE15_10590 [Erythrobacter sp.]|nr:hypothetical protein [Erythrobacter sp.]
MYEARLAERIEVDGLAEHELAALEAQALVAVVAPPAPAQPGFQLPRRVWVAMLGSYATFFLFIALATGGSGHARFAIVVSVLYTAIFFGVARIGARQAGVESRSPLDQGQPLQTWTGPMSKSSVYAQILVVPMAIAFFAVAVALVVKVIA